MRLLLMILTITGRRKSFMPSSSFGSLVSGTLKLLVATKPAREDSEGNQISPDSLSTPPDLSRFFHWLDVILPFFTKRQASPLPSMVPLPVMAMFSTSRADMGDTQRMVLRPSKLVSIKGYSSKSLLKSSRAPSSKWRLILLFRAMGPVNHMPRGTETRPPPFWHTEPMASATVM